MVLVQATPQLSLGFWSSLGYDGAVTNSTENFTLGLLLLRHQPERIQATSQDNMKTAKIVAI